MPAKVAMNWVASQSRWVKKYQGKQYWISPKQLGCTTATKEASRASANQWWQSKLAELESAPQSVAVLGDYKSAVSNLVAMRDYFAAEGQSESASEADLEITELRKAAKAGQPFSKILDPMRRISEAGAAVWQDRLQTVSIASADLTIAAQARKLLSDKQAQVAGKQRSVGRWGAIRSHLDYFCTWIGSETSVEELTAAKLQDFYNHLLLKSELSVIYKRDIFASCKMLVQYVADAKLIVLPTNIRSKNLQFRKVRKDIEVLEIEEVKALLSSANDRVRLYLLLMLNCGMQQSDISDLLHSEVNWKAGRIVRRRSKTEHHANAPTVNYVLWKETFSLLKQFRSADPCLVLVTEKGKALKQEAIVEGKLSKTDCIQSAYRRLCKGGSQKPLKLLRKTAASLLEGHKEYGRYAQHFLGHCPSTVATAHYVVPSQENFDAAIAWLGVQLLG